MNQDPRVLIVESNDVLRTMLFTILRHQPVSVDTAATTDTALRKVTECDYALIIVDVDMPDSAGERFITAFREERPQSTSFVLAVRDPRNDAFLDPQHVSAILNKPIEVDILGELVRECAIAVPPPEEPLECPPSESDIRTRMERGSYIAN
jgi:DNA-binding response OmpR family regulator